MKTMRQTLTLSAMALALSFVGSTAWAQALAQTPLSQPVQTQGSVIPSQSSACGLRAPESAQVLNVREEFAAVNILVSGSPGLTLFIEGPNGFSECHTTSGASGSVNAPGLLNRGRYTFYIGNASPVSTSYQLTISQN
jgi:hypothetical protein